MDSPAAPSLDLPVEIPLDESLFRDILGSINALVLLLDPQGRVIHCCLSSESSRFFKPGSVNGKPFCEIAPLTDEKGNADPVCSTLSEGKREFHYRSALTALNGEKAIISWSLSQIPAGGGTLRYIVATGIDITLQEMMEKRSSEFEARVRSILAYAPLAIFMIDDTSAIVIANRKAAELTGYPEEELKGSSMDILIPESIKARHEALHLQYLKHPTAHVMGAGKDINCLRKDGREVPVEVALSHIDSPSGSLTVCFVSDITVRKTIESELKKAREEFIAILAHDLKNPLASMMGYAQILQRRLGKEADKDVFEYLMMISQSGSILLNQINNIVTASRMDAHMSTYHFESFSFSEVLEKMKALFMPLAQFQEITLEFSSSKDLKVYGDKDKLSHVFENLVINAFRYTPRGGTIGIEARPEGEMAVIKVFDTGKGIPAKDQEHIFEKYRQVQGEKKGTGLGLYIVKNVLEAHRSPIALESSPGKGTSFTFSLPATKEKEAPLAGSFLVVCSNEKLRSSITAYLESEGTLPELASNGMEGLRMASTGDYHSIIISDDLPDLTVKDFMKALKLGEATINVPLIVITEKDSHSHGKKPARALRWPSDSGLLRGMLEERASQ
ncbi:MAG: PAS domain S-box protein [Candidatus Eremiobacteraeota bacterium]|nr:PAS domain S-box protein [Candidatus Eremiobacteraeota bacterium]